MTAYQLLGTAIAESVHAVGTALRTLAADDGADVSARTHNDWSDQFSAASNDQRAARRRVNALYRGATVRL
jgi:hypothetical protein